ncbi:hypothetical protein GLOTRDRAFT_92327 [Gloeophyllum trabeum ATCC 11539]|uniref:Uncharacterized protein n=1 Tax=Gloeophyllum trabeum (strain ATCC 11539 / FP-39264 / Madison 617) TaxID=670483 RepID=S7QCW0_GLOTA|nr:uncharacterized protein GLOTRDRAFT_92327 [Gloeophyllum trabeum ATCC 11539]EPQ57218.1 hypothetical protein GLOTRDRAFT_92327 [Gloeophyllum trabeum ATCC 11539]
MGKTKWADVAPKIQGVSNAIHESFRTEEEAIAVYERSERAGVVRAIGRGGRTVTTAAPPIAGTSHRQEVPTDRTSSSPPTGLTQYGTQNSTPARSSPGPPPPAQQPVVPAMSSTSPRVASRARSSGNQVEGQHSILQTMTKEPHSPPREGHRHCTHGGRLTPEHRLPVRQGERQHSYPRVAKTEPRSPRVEVQRCEAHTSNAKPRSPATRVHANSPSTAQRGEPSRPRTEPESPKPEDTPTTETLSPLLELRSSVSLPSVRSSPASLPRRTESELASSPASSHSSCRCSCHRRSRTNATPGTARTRTSSSVAVPSPPQGVVPTEPNTPLPTPSRHGDAPLPSPSRSRHIDLNALGLSQPIHVRNTSYHDAFDPRSPIARSTSLPMEASHRPVFGRPSPTLASQA